jgi:hypothetical protein
MIMLYYRCKGDDKLYNRQENKTIILLLYKPEQINMNLEFSSDCPNYITKVFTRINLKYRKLT